jgi:F-type H+-transporting ATPase subunit b
VLNAVIHLSGSQAYLPAPRAEEGEAAVDPGPSPLALETKELYWGAGSFVAFAILMRVFLFKRVKSGMDARYRGIQDDHASADATRAAARADVASYEAQLAGVKAEAAARVDAARQTVEAERNSQLAAVNSRVAAARAEATAQAEAAKQAAQGQIQSAVSDVAGRAGELALGRKPAGDVVARVVSEVMAR